MEGKVRHERWGLWNRLGASGKMVEIFSKKDLIIRRQALGSWKKGLGVQASPNRALKVRS